MGRRDREEEKKGGRMSRERSVGGEGKEGGTGGWESDRRGEEGRW